MGIGDQVEKIEESAANLAMDICFFHFFFLWYVAFVFPEAQSQGARLHTTATNTMPSSPHGINTAPLEVGKTIFICLKTLIIDPATEVYIPYTASSYNHGSDLYQPDLRDMIVSDMFYYHGLSELNSYDLCQDMLFRATYTFHYDVVSGAANIGLPSIIP